MSKIVGDPLDHAEFIETGAASEDRNISPPRIRSFNDRWTAKGGETMAARARAKLVRMPTPLAPKSKPSDT